MWRLKTSLCPQFSSVLCILQGLPAVTGWRSAASCRLLRRWRLAPLTRSDTLCKKLLSHIFILFGFELDLLTTRRRLSSFFLHGPMKTHQSQDATQQADLRSEAAGGEWESLLTLFKGLKSEFYEVRCVTEAAGVLTGGGASEEPRPPVLDGDWLFVSLEGQWTIERPLAPSVGDSRCLHGAHDVFMAVGYLKL